MLESRLQQTPNFTNWENVDLRALNLAEVISSDGHLFEVAEIPTVAEKDAQRPQDVVAGGIWHPSQRRGDVVSANIANKLFLELRQPFTGPGNIAQVSFAALPLCLQKKVKQGRQRDARRPDFTQFQISPDYVSQAYIRTGT